MKWIVENIQADRYLAPHGMVANKTLAIRFSSKEDAETFTRKVLPAARVNIVQDVGDNEIVSRETGKAETEYNPYGETQVRQPVRHTVVYGD